MDKKQYIIPSAHRVHFGMCPLMVVNASGSDETEFVPNLGNGSSTGESNTGDGTVLSNRPIRSSSKIWDSMY